MSSEKMYVTQETFETARNILLHIESVLAGKITREDAVELRIAAALMNSMKQSFDDDVEAHRIAGCDNLANEEVFGF